MTSNLGSEHLNGQDGPEASRDLVMEAIQDAFPPEFINRIDEIIVFVSIGGGSVFSESS